MLKKMFLFTKFSSLLCLLTLVLFTSCQAQTPQKNDSPNNAQKIKREKIEFPPLGSPKKIADGILRYESTLKRGNNVSKIWIYVPEKMKSEKLPCVLIAPAGSRLIDGASLGEGSKAEHLPYVKAGFVVVAYDIDDEPKDESDEATLEAVTAFKNSNAGLINQKNALDYALEKVSIINADKIYVAGHSSAATHALLVAANESRLKGVIAYAPATDIEKFLGENLDIFDEYINGLKEFLVRSSPINNTEKIKVPVFLFHAKDDSTVSIKMTEDFAEKLKKTNSDVTLIKAEKGDHYFSMINQGIPKGIEWLKTKI
jgi:dienelactone hydrolase